MDIIILIFIIVIFLLSATIHEVSHAAMASYLGDSTAKLAGRLTLNPLKHLDPLGSVILPGIFLFMSIFSGGNGFSFIGWAKPVPFNPYNLRDQKYGRAKVAAAGPLSNLIVAIVFGISFRFLNGTSGYFFENIQLFFQYIVWLNLLLFIFNLWPGFPFDGHHILFTFFPDLEVNAGPFLNPMFSMMAAIFFMMYIGAPVATYIFQLITGVII